MDDAQIYEPTAASLGETDAATPRRHNRRQVFAVPVGSARTHQPLIVDLRHLLWQLDAACYGMDRELFFDDSHLTQTLRPVCASCPVSTDCRDYADRHGLAGFWGGTTEKERRLDKRRARRRASKLQAADPPGVS